MLSLALPAIVKPVFFRVLHITSQELYTKYFSKPQAFLIAMDTQTVNTFEWVLGGYKSSHQGIKQCPAQEDSLPFGPHVGVYLTCVLG